MEGETVTYHGKYFQIDEVSIEPRPTRRPELWIGGGSQLANEKSPDKPMLVPGGQGAHPQGRGLDPAPDLPARGPGARLGGDPGGDARRAAATPPSSTVAHENFMHFVDTSDGARRGASSTRRSSRS